VMPSLHLLGSIASHRRSAQDRPRAGCQQMLRGPTMHFREFCIQDGGMGTGTELGKQGAACWLIMVGSPKMVSRLSETWLALVLVASGGFGRLRCSKYVELISMGRKRSTNSRLYDVSSLSLEY